MEDSKNGANDDLKRDRRVPVEPYCIFCLKTVDRRRLNPSRICDRCVAEIKRVDYWPMGMMR